MVRKTDNLTRDGDLTMLANVNPIKMDMTTILTPQMLSAGAWISWIDKTWALNRKQKDNEILHRH